MRKKILLLAFCLTAGTASVAHASDIPDCELRVLQPLTDDAGNRWPSGKILSATIMHRDERGTSYCAHGGSCVPAMTNGRAVSKLTNCRIGPSVGGGDYRLVADPRSMGAAAAHRWERRERAEAALARLGFSNAGASRFADAYARDPSSGDGRLTARALAGSRTALTMMRTVTP